MCTLQWIQEYSSIDLPTLLYRLWKRSRCHLFTLVWRNLLISHQNAMKILNIINNITGNMTYMYKHMTYVSIRSLKDGNILSICTLRPQARILNLKKGSKNSSNPTIKVLTFHCAHQFGWKRISTRVARIIVHFSLNFKSLK